MRRLKQLGATELPEYATETDRLFFSQQADTWIMVGGDPAPGVFQLKFYSGCPC